MVFVDQIFLADLGGIPLAPFADFGKKLLLDFGISPPMYGQNLI